MVKSPENGEEDDAGFQRDLRKPRPCCQRISARAWCLLEADHDGPHTGIESAIAAPDPDYSKGKKSG